MHCSLYQQFGAPILLISLYQHFLLSGSLFSAQFIPRNECVRTCNKAWTSDKSIHTITSLMLLWPCRHTSFTVISITPIWHANLLTAIYESMEEWMNRFFFIFSFLFFNAVSVIADHYDWRMKVLHCYFIAHEWHASSADKFVQW